MDSDMDNLTTMNYLNDSAVRTIFPKDAMPMNGSNVGRLFPKQPVGKQGFDPAMEVVYYAKLLLFIAGSFGNLVSLGIWLTKQFRKMSRSVVCSALALVNTLYITLIFTNSTTWHFSREYILSRSDISCKIKIALLGFTQHLNACLILLLSLERLVAVLSTYLVKVIFDRKKTAIYAAVLTIIILAFDVYFVVNNVSSWKPFQTYTACKLVKTFWFQMRKVLFDFIPLIVMIPCNIIIVIKVIYEHLKMRHSIAVTQQQVAKKKSIKVSVLTLSVTISHIVLTVPVNVYILCCNKHTKRSMFVVFTLLSMLNASLNGYAYTLSSKDFRNKVKSIFVKVVTHVLTCITSVCTWTHNTVGPMQ